MPSGSRDHGILGVGLDLIEVSRIEKALKQPDFVEHILHPTEIPSAVSPEWLAGRWAAKEAIAKAVGVHLRWHDVRLHNAPFGGLRVAIEQQSLLEPANVHVTVSIADGMAMAWAIAEFP
jgi:holo-[acyl-carrier protein] synthase